MVMIWNNSTSVHFGNKKIREGEIIPDGAVADLFLKRMKESGNIIMRKKPPEPKKIKQNIKLSISVMAHHSRQNNFKYLHEKLQIPLSQFSIDTENNLIKNCKAAWRLHDKTADFHVVIQDDAIICNQFRERAINFITDMEKKRCHSNDSIYAYNLLFKLDRKANQMSEFEKQGCVIDTRNRGGVAICLPVNQIESMLKYFDTINSRHDDERINHWIQSENIKMIYPIPSLIDHDDSNPSLAGNIINQSRQAYKFIDNMKVTIPKIIHQLWVGPKPIPTKWINSWKEKNPGWEYKLWAEKEIFSTKWINQKHIDYYYKNKIWHGVSDVCQYEILYNNGGFMPSADAICKRPIDNLFFEEFDAYGCYEQEKIRPGLISPLMASVKGSKFAKELIDGLYKLNAVGEPWKCTGNLFMGEMYKKTKQKVKIYPSYTMNPEHFTGEKYEGPGKIYSEQMWGTTIGGYAQGVEKPEPIKLSISVMAHPKRAEFFPYLKERLGDVPFSIDQKNNLLENSKAAWRLYDPEADFHVVIQDDCIVCDNFKERAVQFISEQESKRVSELRRQQGYNFFIKNADDGSKLIINDNFFVDEWTRAGLSICLPTNLIEPMLIEFDKQKSRHDDDRISMFMRLHEYRMVFPFPSLIDHRIDLESLANNKVGNHAIKFIDNENKEGTK